MVAPLKYFCLKHLHVCGEGGGGSIMIPPGVIPSHVFIKCSQLQHLLETKQKQRFLQFPQLCFVTENIYSRSSIGHAVPKYFVSSALKYGTFLGF